ncbi:hypothetical protein FF38_12653 [Lucilia cuprina]|uniref:Uncharacterized protein n=1 Tax=Lucilia cuprina TaxID=7375 RepID=A0A0L0C4A0_LUCCU|nr:hypothetical protein FF38_12653 [Lucilia cuprina]
MKKYDYYYNTNKTKNYTKYALVGVTIIFCLTITTFALIEVHNFYSDEPAIVRILMNSFKSSKVQESTDSVLVQLEEKDQLENKQQFNSDRQARATTNENTTNSNPQKSNTYYEEQKPVVVYSKTDTNPSIAYRQMAEVPPKQDKDEEDPYSKSLADEEYDGSDDYFGQPEQRTPQESQTYYRQQPEQQSYYRHQQPAQPYYRQPPPPPQPYYRQQPPPPPPQSPYYQSPPSSPYYNGRDNDQEDSEEARSSQYRDYPNYYRQYPYATPPPLQANSKILPAEDNPGNRKMFTALSAKTQQQNRVFLPQL